ncbi:MAG: VOC family protein [Candidatus Binatia bacterium]
MALGQATLGHVVLNVRDLKRSEGFYRDILGMRVSGRNRKTRMSFLSFGREHHDIALAELPARAKRTAGEGVPGLHHFCVYVRTAKKVDDLYPVLLQKGIPVVSGPEILEVARNRSISFLDPDGNRVEVACNANKFKRKARRV